MGNAPLLAYFIARRNAEELDRAGSKPGIIIQTVVAVASLASLAMASVFAFGAAIFFAGMMGWY
jgi:hypothetical protein